MSLVITTSPDITLLDFAILYDIAVGTPSITLTNQSVGNPSGDTNLDNCTWWYTITTPSGVYIHQGTQASPDVTDDDWDTLTIPSGSWPTPFGTPPYGQVEFSCGVPYIATLYVMDSDDNIFSTSKSVTICRPNGNTEATKGSFGTANVAVTVKCASAAIYTLDTTNYTYQNIIGVFNQNRWTLAYPMDDQGNIPAPVNVGNQGRVIFNVGYSAEGYQLYLNTTATYDMGDDQTIKVQYKFKSVFAVWCNVSLCAIQCQIDGLMKLSDPTCGKVTDPAVLAKLQQVGFLATQALIGIEQPLCGIDVPAIIEKAKAVGGIPCDCGTTGGINPIASTDGLINIALVLTGLTGDVTNVGNNYTITLEVPGAAAGNLQVVTDNGNVTTNAMIVGDVSATFANLAASKIEVWFSPSQLLAGLGGAPIPGSKGTLWLHTLSAGTVYIQPADLTNTYTIKLPANQGAANTFLKNDGSGNLTWAAPTVATPDLQEVTDEDYVTTNPLKIVDNALKFRRSSSFDSNFMPDTGAASALTWLLQSDQEGYLAFSGKGTLPVLAVGPGAGTGSPTVSFVSGIGTDKGGMVQLSITTPSLSLTEQVLFTMTLSKSYKIGGAAGCLGFVLASGGTAITVPASIKVYSSNLNANIVAVYVNLPSILSAGVYIYRIIVLAD